MDTQVVVMSRWEAQQYIPGEEEVCISIRSHNPNHPVVGDSDLQVPLSDKFDEVLYLQFDDIDPVRYESHRGEQWNPLTDGEADEITAFANKHMNKKKKLIVHCYYGISRSRSTAAAICDRFHTKERYEVLNHFVWDRIMMSFNRN